MSKPRTAYQIFLASRRPALQQEAKDAMKPFSLTESQARLKEEWDSLDEEHKRHFEELARAERNRAMREEAELDEEHAQEQQRRRQERSALPSGRSQRKSVMRDLAKAEVRRTRLAAPRKRLRRVSPLSSSCSTLGARQKPSPQPRGPPKDPEARRRYDERQRLKESRKRARASKEARLADARSRGQERRRAKTQRRAQYLLRQSDFFRDFVDKQGRVRAATPELQRSLSSPSKHAAAASADARAQGKDRTPKRGRKGKQGDDDEDEVDVVRLQSQPALICNGEMRHYQLEGLNWMATLFANGINAILADEMGLGKTLQTISLLAHIKERENVSGPHLIVVPKSTLGNWQAELRRWCPSLRPVVFQGSKAERAEFVAEHLADFDPNAPTFDVLITTYEVVSIEKRHMQPITWCVLTVDEAHRLKNEKSVLATVVREYAVEMRLLLTGTPLQNNLHELWALLNFLMPDIFHSADAFDAEFNIHTDDEEEKRTVITKLHRILRPFMLRRLKSEVAKGLPPKSETMLYVGMSAMQRDLYKNLLLKNKEAFSNSASKSSLSNLVMQLRKACAHPYLFEGVEDRTLDPMGDHVITNCGKMVLLDKLLHRLHQRGSRVLVFSQMTRVLDILEDFCRIREYDYSRIDGNTDSEERDSQIETFNAEGSSKFVFLLSTRAGGLGINLASADTVILYDSDWNPQMDLQAQDRAHRIGQKKHVHVFRLVTEDSVEERIVQSAQAKLRLDAVVIQQGRLTDAKRKVSKSDLLAAVQQGAKDIFRTQGSTITNQDIDAILTDGARRTKDMKDKLESNLPQSEKELMDFKMDSMSTQVFEGVDYGQERKKAEREELRMLMTEQALAEADMLGRRERRAVAHYGKDGGGGSGRGKKHKRKSIYPPHLQEPKMDPWHFFDRARLHELYSKAQSAYTEHIGPEAVAAGTVPREVKDLPPMLSSEEEEEKERLLAEGFGHWTMREYHAFVNAVCVHGRDAISRITRAVQDAAKKLWGRRPKSEEEVRAYADSFWRLGPTHLPDWDRIMRRMEEAAQRRREKKSLLEALDALLYRYVNPWDQLTLQYSASARHTKQGKHFTPQADRYILCMIERHGYGRWHAIRRAILASPALRFDHFLRTRTPAELARRADVLLKHVEKEVSECLQAEVRRAQRLRTGRREVVDTAMGRGGGGLVQSVPNGSAASTPATGASSVATAATAKPSAPAAAATSDGTPAAHSTPSSRPDTAIDPALTAAYKQVLQEYRVGKDTFTNGHRAALARQVAEAGEGGGASRVVDTFVDRYHTLTKSKTMAQLRRMATFESGKKAWSLRREALPLLDLPPAPAPTPMPESARATIRDYMAAKARAAAAGKARMRQQRMTDFGGANGPAPAPEQPPAKRARPAPTTAVPDSAMPQLAAIVEAHGGTALSAMVELAVARVPGVSKRKAADAIKSIAVHEGKLWRLNERGRELAAKAAASGSAAATAPASPVSPSTTSAAGEAAPAPTPAPAPVAVAAAPTTAGGQ